MTVLKGDKKEKKGHLRAGDKSKSCRSLAGRLGKARWIERLYSFTITQGLRLLALAHQVQLVISPTLKQ